MDADRSVIKGVRPPRGALAILATAQLVLALDYSIVNVALPSIGRALGFSQDGVEWVVSAYALTFGGFLLLGGRAADLLGRRRMFLISASIFGVASGVGGFSTVPAMLVATRMIQGVAGAFLFPATLSLVTTLFPEGPARNRAVSVWGATGASGLAAGVFVGGVLTTLLGWRWVFFVNVPVIAVILVLATKVLPRTRMERPTIRDFDLPGAVAVTAGSMLFVLGLVQVPVLGWGSQGVLLPVAIGLALLGVFVAIEARSKTPLLPLALFRRRTLWGGMLVTAAFMASFGIQFFFLTLYLQDALGKTPIVAGLMVLPLAALVVVGTRVGGRLATRIGVSRVLPMGLLIGSIGLFLYTRLSGGGSLATLFLAEVIAGLGQGITFTTAYLAAVSGVPTDRQGVGSSMASAAQQIGGSIGLALLVDVLSSRLGTGGARLALEGGSPADLVPALHVVFVGETAAALAGALVAFFVIGRAGRKPTGVRSSRPVAPEPTKSPHPAG